MQNLYSYNQRQQNIRPPPEQTSGSFRQMKPRSSYQEEHSNYFQKLEQQLLQRSNRYTSLIGKKGFMKHPSNMGILQKTSQLKQKNPNSFTQQIKPSKNNSFSQLALSRKEAANSSLHKSTNYEDQSKSRFTHYPSKFVSNHSRTNLHSELQMLNPKVSASRQETQRNHDLKLAKNQQRLQQKSGLITKDKNIAKNHKTQYLWPNEFTNKIDHIKQLINSFNSAKKGKMKQKPKESTLELHRKLVYNLTYEDRNLSSVEDLPDTTMSQSRIRKQTENQGNFIKTSKDNLSSTISTKISINNNSNESSKVSFCKKQNDQLENQYFGPKQIENPSIANLSSSKNIQAFNNVSKIVPHLGSKVPLKSSIRQVKPMSIKDFVILAQIGEGKAGTVYMAKHIESNFVCALKVINREILNQNVIVQLVREIQIQFYLDHPNIVQLYAFFSDESHIYLILELCFSGNLYTHLRRQKILTETQIKPIIRQVCYALQFMHDNDIIHRDLKPENILFHQNVVKICDLGWAVYSPLPRDTLCGTPIYASPELVEKKKYNSKIDVWNVGVMAYELLCGRVPFEIRSEEDLYKVVIEEIHFPKSIPISDFCKDFINCCLKKQPQKRKTITQLLEHSFLNENII